jgi:hypothetical protein
MDGRVVSSDVVRGDLRFVGFSRIFLLGTLIFKGLTARRLYKSFGVKGLTLHTSYSKLQQIFNKQGVRMSIGLNVLGLGPVRNMVN